MDVNASPIYEYGLISVDLLPTYVLTGRPQ